MSRQQWINLKNKLGRKVKWNVRIQTRYEHGNGVLTYLARYVRGGPISNKRIIGLQDNTVFFRYRVNGENGKKNSSDIMDLSVDEFIIRLMQHVPEKRTQVVRAWGLYSSSKRKELNRCRQIFGQLPAEEPEFLTWQEALAQRNPENNPQLCPVCGKKLVDLGEICPVRGFVEPPMSNLMKKLLALKEQREARAAPT